MTDILDQVTLDEATFPLEIQGKNGSTGVVFHVRDLHNIDTQKEHKRERNRHIGKRMTKKEQLSDEEVGEMFSIATTDPTDAMLACCVTAWEWPEGATFGKLSIKYSHANVVAILQAAPWIRAQVLAKALEITDFTKA